METINPLGRVYDYMTVTVEEGLKVCNFQTEGRDKQLSISETQTSSI